MSDFNSEDLEKSLYREVETYLAAHLSGVQQELENLQGEIKEALARVAGKLKVDDDPSGSPLAVVVTEHLQTAQQRASEKLAALAAAARKHESRDVALLKAAVDEINQQSSHAEILNALVAHAASFAPRVCLFVVKSNNAVGWRARGLENGMGDDAIRDVTLPLSDDTLLSHVVKSRAAWSGASDAHADALTNKLGGETPQQIVAVPLVARDKAVAILYGDSGSSTAEAVNLEALEILVRVASMAVELRAAAKRQPAQTGIHPPTAAPQAEAAPPATQVEATYVTPPVEYAAPQVESAHDAPHVDVARAEPTHAEPAHIEPSRDESAHAEVAPPPASAFGMPSPATFNAPEPAHFAPVVAEQMPAPASYEIPSAPAMSSVGVATAPSVETAPRVETPSYIESPSQPAAPPQTTPLAGRRYGSDVELPIQVSDDERRFHIDARRFARLLVSEIKLYNEQKVRDGRETRDLYERLRDEVDRSRQMYDKRVSPQVAARYDYFHHELVNTLAEGDPSKLGANYLGAQAVS